MRRSTSEEGQREQAIWRAAKFAALFLLSFAVTFRLYAGVQPPSSNGPALRLRSLREANGPGAALPSSSRTAAGLRSSGGGSAGCRHSFGICTRTRQRSPGNSSADASILADFDWEAYLQYYPALKRAKIIDEASAAAHYLSVGRAEGRVGRRLRVVLRYVAGTGLINQHYSHIAALSLAAVLGAEVVLPPAMHRSSFEHVFSVFKGQSSVRWAFSPLGTLYDVDAIISNWRDIGVKVHRTPRILRTPDLSQPQTAFPTYAPSLPEVGGVPDFLAARMHNVFGQNLDMAALVRRSRAAVLDTAQAALRLDPDVDVSTVALDLPCTFFMLNSAHSLAVVEPVARTLVWAPAVQALADKVVAGLAERLGGGAFNGVHLRIEKDAEAWSQILGGRDVVEARYRDAMRRAAFDGKTPLYVASALLTYDGGMEDLQQVVGNLTAEGLASGAVYKEMFLSAADTKGLHSEQKGLIDFLVLARASRFVGFGPSTYSFFLREYRSLVGAARESSVLVDGSAIGTDPLFQAAGVLTAPPPGEAGDGHAGGGGGERPRLAEGAPQAAPLGGAAAVDAR